MLSQRLFVKSVLLVSMLPGAVWAQAGTASLSLSVNGTTEAVVYRGWPLQVEARALLDEGETAEVQWPSAVHLTIRNSTNGAAVVWPLQMIANADELVVVSGDRSPGALWILGADATAVMSPGEYTIQADHPAAGRSRLLMISVGNEPAELSREQLSLKARLRSRYEELTGTREAALQILNDRLVDVPDDIGVLGQKADLLGDMEQFAEALSSAQLAVRAFADQFKDVTHPPFGLLRRVRMLQGKLEAF